MMLIASFGTVMITLGIITTSVLLIGLILLQKNRGAGLSGAFGGVGGYSAFGTKTGDFLTWVTCGLVAVFLLLNIVGNYVFEPSTIAPAQAVAPGQMPPPADGTPGNQPMPVQVPPSSDGQPVTIQVPPQPSGQAQPVAVPAAPANPAPVPTTQPS